MRQGILGTAHREVRTTMNTMTTARILGASETARLIRGALAGGDVESADRLLTESISRLLSTRSNISSELLIQPDSTGDKRYDTLLATAMAFALAQRGLPAESWMLRAPALKPEWLWDGDDEASPEFRAFIRTLTPAIFLDKGVLLREQDLITL